MCGFHVIKCQQCKAFLSGVLLGACLIGESRGRACRLSSEVAPAKVSWGICEFCFKPTVSTQPPMPVMTPSDMPSFNDAPAENEPEFVEGRPVASTTAASDRATTDTCSNCHQAIDGTLCRERNCLEKLARNKIELRKRTCLEPNCIRYTHEFSSLEEHDQYCKSH